MNSTVRQSPQPEPERVVAAGILAASPLAPQTTLTSTGRRVSDVLIIPLSLLCTCVHDLKTPLAKLRFLDVLSTFSRYDFFSSKKKKKKKHVFTFIFH